MKKIVLITYSTTGNTKFVEESIARQLRNHFSVNSFDAVSIIKQLSLVKLKKSSDINLLGELKESLLEADIVGVGGFSWSRQTPPGLTDIFSEKNLPIDCFKNMKFFFSYGTAGQSIGFFHDIIATLFFEKNKNAIFAGKLTVLTPENFSPLLPPKGFRDMWSQKEIDKIEPFTYSLIQVFNGMKKETIPYKNEYVKPTWLYPFNSLRAQLYCGKVSIDRKRCKKCGFCAKNCPYGAMTMDIEDTGFPVCNHELCTGCHLCFNRCSNEAINFKNTKNKSRHSSPFLHPASHAPLTESANGTVKGIPLPGPPELKKRYSQHIRREFIRLIVIFVLVILVLFS